MAINNFVIPFIPTKAKVSDLHSNLKLYSNDEIKQLQKMNLVDGKHRYVKDGNQKKKLKFAIFVKGNRHFAVYTGKRKLGTGGFGSVKLAQDLLTSEWYALKVQEMDEDDNKKYPNSTPQSELKRVAKLGEAIKLTRYHSPFGFDRYSPSKSRQQYYFLMHYAHGMDLSGMDEVGHDYSLAVYIKIIIAVLNAVKGLHKQKFLHRDLKLANTIIDRLSGKVKLIDYGLAIEMNRDGEFVEENKYGTSEYMAPELKNAKKYKYSVATEMFALGILIGILLKLVKPSDQVNFDSDEVNTVIGENTDDYKNKTRIQDVVLRKKIAEYVKQMIHPDPKRRPHVNEVIGFFCEIKKNLRERERIYNVGVLDATLFANTVGESRKELINRMKKYDEIWLVDEKLANHEIFHYGAIKQELELNKLVVGDQIFYGAPVKEIVGQMSDLLRYHRDEDYIYSYSAVSEVDNTLLPEEKSEINEKETKGSYSLASLMANYCTFFANPVIDSEGTKKPTEEFNQLYVI